MPHEKIDTSDTTSASWSHIAIDEDDSQSPAFKPKGSEQCGGYQLGRWTYEVCKDNLTFTEKLEKMRWETESLQKL
jgi:hypothetical protein